MGEEKPIRVFIADDHPVVRRGLASLISISEGMELVGWPTVTILGGRLVAEGGRPVGDPTGTYLHRTL